MTDPSPDIAAAKRRLRERMRAVLKAMAPEEAAERGARACRRVVAAGFFRRARTVMLYAPIVGSGELDTGVLAAECARTGRRVCVARVDWEGKRLTPAVVEDWQRGLVAGRYGVREPGKDAAAVPAADLDLVIVPGLAFDRSGHRLGHGAGFYDRFLAEPGLRAFICGMGYAVQIVAGLARLVHDVPMQAVVTEDEVITPQPPPPTPSATPPPSPPHPPPPTSPRSRRVG